MASRKERGGNEKKGETIRVTFMASREGNRSKGWENTETSWKDGRGGEVAIIEIVQRGTMIKNFKLQKNDQWERQQAIV